MSKLKQSSFSISLRTKSEDICNWTFILHLEFYLFLPGYVRWCLCSLVVIKYRNYSCCKSLVVRIRSGDIDAKGEVSDFERVRQGWEDRPRN
jgi:hypothetical protein